MIFDDGSRRVWVYLMREKEKASTSLQNFVTIVRIQFGKNMKIIRSDNGSEFVSGPMKQFYSDQGIIHQTMHVDTPQ